MSREPPEALEAEQSGRMNSKYKDPEGIRGWLGTTEQPSQEPLKTPSDCLVSELLRVIQS